MVNDEGQLYTLEGLSAALIMIVTMYLVLGTTSIYTPGDTHITDMQLEQIGSDVLEIMDTPSNISEESELEVFVRDWNWTGFDSTFRDYLRNTAGIQSTGLDNTLQYRAMLYYSNTTDVIKNYPIDDAKTQTYNGREPAVKVTRLVSVREDGVIKSKITDGKFSDNRTVLLEVLLWRGGT
jgi:hypothetical protein